MKKVISVIIAIIFSVALTITIGIGSSAFTNWKVKTWFNNWGKGNKITAPDDTQKDTTTDGNGIMLLSSTISENDYAAYGVSEQAISAKTLTAEFTPANATDRRVTWSYDWKYAGGQSSNYTQTHWKDGQKFHFVFDYIKLTPGENNSPTATVSVLKPFGCTIVVTCTSVSNPELSATCNIEYVGRYENFSDEVFAYNGNGYESLDDFMLDAVVGTDGSDDISGNFTVDPDYYNVDITFDMIDSTWTSLFPDDLDQDNNPVGSFSGEKIISIYEVPITNFLTCGGEIDLSNKQDKLLEYATIHAGETEPIAFAEASIFMSFYWQGEFIYSKSCATTFYITKDVIDLMSVSATDITVTTPVVPF